MEKIILLETVLDHLTGEELGAAICALNDMPEILDAIYLPGIGKKNRPAGLLQAMCKPDNEQAAVRAVFRHTHTLGVRRTLLDRYVLPRAACKSDLAGHTVRAKLYNVEHEDYVRPEADDLITLARQLNAGMPALRFAKHMPS